MQHRWQAVQEENSMPKNEHFDRQDKEPELPGDYLTPEEEAQAMGEYDLDDPDMWDIERLLQEVKGDFQPDEPQEIPMDDPIVPAQEEPQEFRDQEYRDVLGDGFELAFDETEEGEAVPANPNPDDSDVGCDKSPRRKAIKKKGSGLLGIPHFISTIVLAALVIAMSLTLARVLWLWADDVLALTKTEQEIKVSISDSDTMNDISQKLEDAGLIRYPFLFNMYCNITSAREKISEGEYMLNSIYDYHALVDSMSGYSSNRTIVEVMIPEGYETRQIFELLEANKVCTVEELESAAVAWNLDQYDFLKDINVFGANRLEGFLFPDTYEFYQPDDPDRVIGKMLRNFNNRFDENLQADLEKLNIWFADKLRSAGYDEDYIQKHTLTVRDVVIVASMIERETAGSGESATIASVIYNRLVSPDYLYLNIDATIQYALGERKPNLTIEDTKIDSPYNTYINPGLPIGPISNPGLNSLRAALHPEDTDYYYYALKTDGMHHFSRNQEEHDAFLASLEEEDDE